MSKTHEATETTYYIAHNQTDVFHAGRIEDGQNVSTGQPELEVFTDYGQYLDRCSVLGIEEPAEE